MKLFNTRNTEVVLDQDGEAQISLVYVTKTITRITLLDVTYPTPVVEDLIVMAHKMQRYMPSYILLYVNDEHIKRVDID